MSYTDEHVKKLNSKRPKNLQTTDPYFVYGSEEEGYKEARDRDSLISSLRKRLAGSGKGGTELLNEVLGLAGIVEKQIETSFFKTPPQKDKTPVKQKGKFFSIPDTEEK